MLALIVSHPSEAIGAPPLSVSFTSSFYFVATIGVSARQAVFSDKYNHASFLRTVPPYSREAEIWADLIVRFGWREVCVIHSDNQDAKTLLSGLEKASKARSSEHSFKLLRQVVINTDEEDAAQVKDFVGLLKQIHQEQTRAVLVFLKRRFAEYIFDAARKLGMLEAEWAWIVSEQALQASNVPQGIIGVRLLQASELDHVEDAVRVATQGILSMIRTYPEVMRHIRSVSACRDDPQQIQSKPSPTGEVYEWHEFATKLYNHMVQVKFSDGRTGQVEFDQRGDRIRPIYEVVNAQYIGLHERNSEAAAQSANQFGQQQNMKSSDVSTHGSFGFKRPELVSIGRYGISSPEPDEWLAETPYPHLLAINMSQLVWPGNSRVRRNQLICVRKASSGKCQVKGTQLVAAAPLSFKKKTHLKVVTAESIPFVYKRPRMKDEPCNRTLDAELKQLGVPCVHTDPKTGLITQHCCYGFCIDLLSRLANRSGLVVGATSFTYDLHLVGDGQIGEEVVENETRRWTGVVGEILSGQADLAVAPVSITPERAARIEFSKPFKYLGLTILIKRERAKSNLGSFLQPFENTLWVLVALSVHAVAWVLYLLDRFSPFGLYKPSATHELKRNCVSPEHVANDLDTNYTPESLTDLTRLKANEEERNNNNNNNNSRTEGLNLSSAVYFAWGVLLNSGIGEGTPRSFSSRVLGMVWAGFAMIIVASYTANLAAFLVLDRPESSISGIDDMRLRNPQKDFTFATVRGTPVEMFFKRQMEYSTMYRIMESLNYATVDEALEAVKKGTLKAFIWDSARLSYEASMHCDLITAGEVFGRGGYGLAMKKGNPWLDELSQSVLNFHERGFMEKLDSQWIHVNADYCERTESSPATLGLTNMAGVFIMVAAGIISGIFITLAEIACRQRRRSEQYNFQLAATAIHRWRKRIGKKPRSSEANNNNNNNKSSVVNDQNEKTQPMNSSV